MVAWTWSMPTSAAAGNPSRHSCIACWAVSTPWVGLPRATNASLPRPEPAARSCGFDFHRQNHDGHRLIGGIAWLKERLNPDGNGTVGYAQSNDRLKQECGRRSPT